MDKTFYQVVVSYTNLPTYRSHIIHTRVAQAQRYYDDNKDRIHGTVGKNPNLYIMPLVLDDHDGYEGIYPHSWLWIFPVEVDYMIFPEEGSIPQRVDILDIYANGDGWIDKLSKPEYDQVVEWCKTNEEEKT